MSVLKFIVLSAEAEAEAEFFETSSLEAAAAEARKIGGAVYQLRKIPALAEPTGKVSFGDAFEGVTKRRKTPTYGAPLAVQVPAAVFASLLARAQELGGWYASKEKAFTFRTSDACAEFRKQCDGEAWADGEPVQDVTR